MELTGAMVYRTAEIIIDRAAGKLSEDEDAAVREIIKAAYYRGVMDMADQIVEDIESCKRN